MSKPTKKEIEEMKEFFAENPGLRPFFNIAWNEAIKYLDDVQGALMEGGDLQLTTTQASFFYRALIAATMKCGLNVVNLSRAGIDVSPLLEASNDKINDFMKEQSAELGMGTVAVKGMGR